ncbi:MAG: hypothetical protein RSC26_16235 [Terrisporobacter sp.]
MKDSFMMNLSDIQPSQLYINQEKLSNVLKWIQPNNFNSYDPIPVKRLNDRIIFVDGHTRAFAIYLSGVNELKVRWHLEEENWDSYQICVDWCLSENINSIGDLYGRLLNKSEYISLWINRCSRIF